MNISLSANKGRTVISTTIEVPDTNQSEEDLQELIVHFIDFLHNAGIEMPDEIIDLVEEYLEE